MFLSAFDIIDLGFGLSVNANFLTLSLTLKQLALQPVTLALMSKALPLVMTLNSKPRSVVA